MYVYTCMRSSIAKGHATIGELFKNATGRRLLARLFPSRVEDPNAVSTPTRCTPDPPAVPWDYTVCEYPRSTPTALQSPRQYPRRPPARFGLA